DTHVEVHALRATQLVRVGADGPGHVPRRMAGATRVILLGKGCTEEGHDPVAGEFVDGAAEAANLVGEDVHETVDDLGPGLDVEVLLKLHRALDVREEDSQLLALPLPLASGGRRGRW